MKKIGISTVYTGFNYGSCLQAYASQTYISKLGYDARLISYRNGLVKGRDIRIEKIFGLACRTVVRPKLFKKTFLTYKNSLKKEMSNATKEQFLEFQDKRLKVEKLNWKQMKKFAEDRETVACICGSDQIWNSTNVYVDPIFYLRYAPINKRIAYAPSLGKSYVPKYNEKIMKKYINGFKYISVREKQGAELIRDLIQKEAKVVVDPTLLLNNEEWHKSLDIKKNNEEKYILVYFLDKPSRAAIEQIKKVTQKNKMKIYGIPYKYDEYSELKNIEYVDAGPEKFLELISNAEEIYTDSFHGMVFSINFNKNFYIFQRNYGNAVDQSSRITSLLEKLNLSDRFISTKIIEKEIDFDKVNCYLEKEREQSKAYLDIALETVKKE
ncbi:polysaccharide pyruvyl transferase family protein [uncultured Clostridium sp.]|uniref:polysaccharide pyruvyl transferase family protein n=1 Tax=uncultured Clostridium sp. TaxID=59620 RepID=UPI002615BF56|nr:polysaccharide pyruvyl transferase family protein [uncultured Clostridium sp.]